MNLHTLSPSQNTPAGPRSNVVPLYPETAGNAELFARYVEPFIPLVRRCVAAKTLPGDDVDDNLQEVLVHLFVNIHRYNPAQSLPAPWLCRVAANKMDHLNRPSVVAPVVIPFTDLAADAAPSAGVPQAAAARQIAAEGPDDDADADAEAEDLEPAAAFAEPASAFAEPATESCVPASAFAEPASGLSAAVHSEATVPEACASGSMLGASGSIPAVPASVPARPLDKALGWALFPSPDLYPRTFDALRRLTPQDRSIIILHAEGWPAREIADELCLTTANVSQRIFRIKARLRVELARLCPSSLPHEP